MSTEASPSPPRTSKLTGAVRKLLASVLHAIAEDGQLVGRLQSLPGHHGDVQTASRVMGSAVSSAFANAYRTLEQSLVPQHIDGWELVRELTAM